MIQQDMTGGLDDDGTTAAATGHSNDAGIDETFLNNFRSMGTSSRDDLIKQFKALIDSNISDEHCEFFLDSSSWNLQVALCLYFDTNVQPSSPPYQQQPLALCPAAPPHSPKSHQPTPILTPELDWESSNLLDETRPSPLICDNSVQEVEASPGQMLMTTWLIRNSSDSTYSHSGLHLLPMAAAEEMPRIPLPETLGPNQTVPILTEITVHHLPGITYSIRWHVADVQNRLLSGPLTLRITVLPANSSTREAVAFGSVPADDAMDS